MFFVHGAVATAIYTAGEELGGERITRGMALAALEKAALTEKVSILRGMALKLPFSSISDEGRAEDRSEEHTSELQSLMRISYAVFCLNKKLYHKNHLSYHKILYTTDHDD